MKPDTTEFHAESLALALNSTVPVTFSTEQVAMLRLLMEQFAADQVAILTMQRRLALFEQSAERMDRALSSGLNLLSSRLDRPAVDEGFDHAASKRIREELADAIARSSRPEEIWAAAARAAFRLIRLL